MKPIALLLVLQLLAGAALAADVTINIGGTPFTIPIPNGYAPVTKEMAAFDEMLEAFVSPENTRFISFIPQEDVPVIQRGEYPRTSRIISVQTNKKTAGSTVTRANFADLKEGVRQQNAALATEVERELPGLIDRVIQRNGYQFNSEQTLNLSSAVPFPPHEETERSMSCSMLLKFSTKDDRGLATNSVGFVTTTFVHAKGKLFFVYVNGDESDFGWTRQFSKEWVASIVKANPPDAATAARESARAGSIDFNRVLRTGLMGAAVGGMLGLINKLTRRKSAA